MVYLDIRDCDICPARQVDVHCFLALQGYRTACRNCSKLIKGILKECRDNGTLDKENLKDTMRRHISERISKHVNFKSGLLLEVLLFYAERKNLLDECINEEPKGIEPENEEKEKYIYGKNYQGRMQYKYENPKKAQTPEPKPQEEPEEVDEIIPDEIEHKTGENMRVLWKDFRSMIEDGLDENDYTTERFHHFPRGVNKSVILEWFKDAGMPEEIIKEVE